MAEWPIRWWDMADATEAVTIFDLAAGTRPDTFSCLSFEIKQEGAIHICDLGIILSESTLPC